MEEWIGGVWDRFITRTARRDHPEAVVELAEVEKMAGVLFRAMGGDAGLRVSPAQEQRHGARRRWLSRLAHTDEKAAHAALDGETLRLPPTLSWFPARALNRDLYLWLIAQAAHDSAPDAEWLIRNQHATLAALKHYPGLASRHRRLLEAHLAERIAPEAMPPDEAAQERAIRMALTAPGSVTDLPPLSGAASHPPQPVPLWLYPLPPAGMQKPHKGDGGQQAAGDAKEARVAKKRHDAEREEMPENDSPMILFFRAESLLSWAEYVNVNRALDDDENPDAGRAADNMDKLTIAEDDKNQRIASKVRFDLDLPSAAADDIVLGPGIPLPEWDYRKHAMLRDWCRLQPMSPRDATPAPLPEHLRRPARKLKSQFAALAPVRRWLKAQPEGSEIDIDACLRLQADRIAGYHFSGAGAYLQQRQSERDLACLVLADLSLSTDAYVSDDQRVIDVIRDSLLLFAEALSATGDRYGMYGFSSLKRGEVRFLALKEFAGPLDAGARGRIAAIRPGYYTRMGAAIRHATRVLEKQPQSMRLLLMLTDGKPHDIDGYEGRYGIEDTRKALIEAREAGVRPFCVTIDREGASYLPHLFGPGGYTVLRKPEELPARLPILYAQLTQH